MIQLRSFRGHQDAVTALAFQMGAGAATLFSGSNDRTLKLWNAKDLGFMDTLYGHQAEVRRLQRRVRGFAGLWPSYSPHGPSFWCRSRRSTAFDARQPSLGGVTSRPVFGAGTRTSSSSSAGHRRPPASKRCVSHEAAHWHNFTLKFKSVRATHGG